ncbi:MAG: glycosyltransferase [Planctomycetota bacterium]
MARRTLRFAQLAHEVLRDAGVAFDYIEFADYEANGSVALAEQRLFGTHGDAVLAVVLHSPTHDCWLHNDSMHVFGPTEREIATLEDEAIRMAPLVWSPSENLRDSVCNRLGIARDQIPIVRYPMACANPAEASAKRTTASSLAELSFIYCGRIEPRKGVRELAAMCRQLPEITVDCYGRDSNTSPPQSSEAAALSKVAPNLRCHGHIARDALLARMQEADVVLLPSRWDNWPNTCLEAMSKGRIVVAGDNSGMPEMIQHGIHGFLFRSGDGEDLARVLREDVEPAIPRFAEIRAAAMACSRELCDRSTYVAAIAELVAKHRGRGRLRAHAEPAAATVSIIVPYYGEDAEMLGEALASARAQTHSALEILVVNDGSPRSDAPQILAAAAATDARIRVLHKDNGGVASARNHAIAEAVTGDFILCLDADNRLRPEYAEIGLQTFARCPEAVAVVPRFEIFDDVSNKTHAVVQALPFDRPLAIFRNSLGDGGAMFRTSVFREHGLRYDPAVDCYSDWALWLDIARLGLRVQSIPRTLYEYRQRSGSMMAERSWHDHQALLGLLIQRHLPDGDADSDREMLVTLAQGWGVGALLAALGKRHELWEDASSTALDAMEFGPASRRFEQAFEKLAERHRILGSAGLSLTRLATRLHGKWKRKPPPA